MKINQFLDLCLTYPSGDNCQPFKFKIVSENSFEVYHDAQVAKHRLNCNHIASILSLGTLLELISIVAKGKGLKPEAKVHEENFEVEKLCLWAEVSLDEVKEQFDQDDQILINEVSKRCVDRRLYENKPLLANHIQWIQNEASKNKLVNFSFHSNLNPRLLKLIVKLEEKIWMDERVSTDILRWIRFDQNEIIKLRDGLSWDSLCLAFYQKPILKLFCNSIKFYSFMTKLGGTKVNSHLLHQQLKKSGGIGVFAVHSKSNLDLVNMARTYFRIWLYLNSRGYAFQPLTNSTLPLYMMQTQKLPADWPQANLNIYKDLMIEFRIQCGFGENEVPVWGFRSGSTTKPLPAKARSLRKNLDELLL